MLKSILSLFGSLGGMILKVMLTIASVIMTGFCAFTAFSVPFRWGGALRILGAVASAALFAYLVRERRDRDAEEDGDGTREDYR
ncbi:MAG: hypothetical protein IJK29_11715 [Bacteroidales bacterium]|nr:hypothetical protein [Bacteroidales bacterium]MBQ6177858.1 hypothetical protein [Bacteroidales bacterium]